MRGEQNYGTLKAGAGALGGVLADQRREFFCCESLDADTLVAKGEKRVGKRSSNKKGDDNIISNGSIISINEGQSMIIVESGKFCMNCGKLQPVSDGWTCSCGTVNKGRFCWNCGNPKPAGVPTCKCNKCGWEPEDPKNPPKFCPECGDIFDDNDKQ